MSVNEAWVTAVAGSILDGHPVDWDTAAGEKGVDDTATLDSLRKIEAVVKAHRRLTHAVAPGVDPSATNQPAQAFQWGHLRVMDVIGRGAFGCVYRAWDARLAREVALKLLTRASSGVEPHDTAVIEEGRLLARVRHPNVVTIYGAEHSNGRTGLWMELVHGATLAEARAAGVGLDPSEVVTIGMQLCGAVDAVHTAGLIHGDIKPQNVMRDHDGRIVLMDFGTGHEPTETSSAVAGTPLYLAPEVLEGNAPTRHSDVYSLGVLLFFLLTGRHPVTADSLPALRRAHRAEGPLPRRVLRRVAPRALARVVERALDRDPARRFDSAAELASALASTRRRFSRTAIIATAASLLIATLWWLGAGGGGSRQGAAESARDARVGAQPPVVVVLPFHNVGDDVAGADFVDGFTADLINVLARVDGLHVRSQTSSFMFKDRPRNLRAIAGQLGAAFVVEGTVARSGGRLRITAQLAEVSTDHTVWSQRFDRSLDDVFAIQDELSRSIATRLELTIAAQARSRHTDIGTYDAYLRARLLLDRRSLGNDSAKAASLFRQVIASDPDYAPGYAGLALAYAYLSLNPYPATALSGRGTGVSFVEADRIMRDAAGRALALDPALAEAHAAMGWVHARRFEWQQARQAFRRAIALNPIATHTYTNFSFSTLRPLELHSEAEQVLRTALVHDPLSVGVRRELAELLIQSGRVGEALTEFRNLIAEDPRGAGPHGARALTQAGEVDAAIAQFESLGAGAAGWLAHAYVKIGRRGAAEQLARTHGGFPFHQAIIAAALGDNDAAFAALGRMVTAEPQRLALLLAQPELSVLRADRRLVALRARLRLS